MTRNDDFKKFIWLINIQLLSKCMSDTLGDLRGTTDKGKERKILYSGAYMLIN